MSLASSSSPLNRADAPLFTDGVGQRVVAAEAATGELLQILRVRPELTAVPSFEFALRERTARLMNFRHAYYARVRRVDRMPAAAGLVLVSDHVEGTRLADILRVAHERGLQLDTNAALCLIRQLVPAVALLHENARDASHGLIAPERIVVTPHARLVIVEHVLGSAIEQLQFGRERLWNEFRIALPSSAGMARFDHRADVNGIGITALSLVLGRPLRADEFPHAIPQLLTQATERSSMGDERPLSTAFRSWLGRTLQLDVRRAFGSAPEALAALDETLASDPSYVAAPVALETFLSQFTAVLTNPAPAPATVPAATPVTLHSVPRASGSAAPAVAATTLAGAAAASPRSVDARQPARAPEPVRAVNTIPTLADLIPVADLRPGTATAGKPSQTPEPTRQVDVARESVREEFRDADSELSRALDELTPVLSADVVESAQPVVATMPPPSQPKPPARSTRSKGLLVAAAAVLVMVIGGGVFASKFYGGGTTVPSLGTLVVQSSPAGVEVFVDGVSRGMTPAKVSVAAGAHILELRGRGVPRVIPLQVPAGGQISQYLEFADTPTTGMLVVHSQPAGAKVTVDGVERGVAPITLEGLSAGDHEVVLQHETVSSRHVVKVLAGTTASLVAPVAAQAAEGPVSGWISVKAPVSIEIHEDGRLIGTTEADRLMLASGKHVLEFVNQTLGFRQTRAVQVVPGKTVPLTIELPRGTINLNASPWAEVWIDGRRVGETPIGNLDVAIGPHEIVFRHPEFGEKKHAVTVTAAAPVRLSVSMK